MSDASAHPNVLWIFADQLRYHALSSSGDPNVATPHIDRLVAQGVTCTQAVSQYPVCVPFRASLVTGNLSPRNGTMRHGDYLPPGTPTIAHAFREAGYATSYVGKWHLAPETGAAAVTPEGWIGQSYWVHPGFRGGFEEWCGFNVSNNYLRTYVATGEQIEAERLEGHQTDALTDRSLAILARQSRERPWFHVISYEAPHPGAGGNPRSPLYPVPEAYESLAEPASGISNRMRVEGLNGLGWFCASDTAVGSPGSASPSTETNWRNASSGLIRSWYRAFEIPWI